MYRVMLVDDEPWALLGIRNCYDWEANGFEVICQTTDPCQALDVIRSKKPDVVFTDIYMQEMNGIELMKIARSEGSDSEFIVVSGYSDFSYAQEAIKYGIFYYLLKPIEKKEVNSLLANLLKHFEQKRDATDNMELMDFIYSLPFESGSTIKYLTDNHFSQTHPYYQVLVAIGLSSYHANAITFPEQVNPLRVYLGSNKYAYFLNTDTDLSEYVKTSWSGDVLLTDVVFGLSTLSSSINNINESFREADIAANSRFLTEYDQVDVYCKHDAHKKAALINGFLAKIGTSPNDTLMETLDRLPAFSIKNKLRIDDITTIYNQLLSKLSSTQAPAILSSELEFLTYDQLYRKYKDINDMCVYLKEIINNAKKQHAPTDYRSNENFAELLKYVETNFDKPLYLSDLSKKFYLSSTYICDLFRKIKGKTLVEYITELRLTQAASLLTATTYPVLKIADMSGYGDYCYFGKSFKKYFGVTPNKYRQLHANHMI